jgi:ketosteroid isomerase-like protein
MSTPNSIREAFISSAERGDIEGVIACYAPDAVLIAPEGHFEGRGQIAAFYNAQFGAASDIRLEIAARYDLPDTGVAEWSFNGTSTGSLELPDGRILPATGQRVTQRGVDVFTVADGRIREHRLYYDQVELIQQLTAVPAGEGQPA